MLLSFPLLFLLALQAWAEKPMPVNVMNTPSNPVPVTGSLGLTGNANVTVTNTASNPLPVVVTALEPFQATNSDVVNEPSLSTTITVTTVPAGKRLIVEHVSVDAGLYSPQRPQVRLFTGTSRFPGIGGDFLVFQTEPQNYFSPGTHFYASAQTKIYVNPGESLFLELARDNDTRQGQFSWFVSGYLVQIP